MMRHLALLLFIVLAGCGSTDTAQAPQDDEPTISSPSATRVEIATLGRTETSIAISLPGEVEGSRDALLAAAQGGQVERVAVDAGDTVTRGQLLVAVDSAMYAAQADQAEARLAQARSDLARLGKLGDMATDADVEQASTQVALAEADLKLAKARLSRALVRAPFAGTVGQVEVEEGEFAAPGNPVVRLVKLDPAKITLSVPDRDVVALQQGMPVDITASARSGIYQGTITHIGATADLRTRAFPVEVEVANPEHQLLPGMITRITARRSLADDQVVIPQHWVITDVDEQGVFLEQDGVAKWRPVQLGQVVRDQVVVESGLSPGDRVVITGHRDLAPGDELLVAREGRCCEKGRPVFGEPPVAAQPGEQEDEG